MVGKGAKYVTVVNLPDLANTPGILAAEKASAGTQALVALMVNTFNAKLTEGLGTDARILLVDAYTTNHDQITNKGIYGLSVVDDTACDLTAAKNPFGSSLICNAANIKAGDVSKYLFADDVHPTPYGYWLLARYVSKDMAIKGWM